MTILSLTFISVEARADANNDPSGASLLNLGSTYAARIDPAGDIDWAKFFIPGPGTIHVDFDVPVDKNYDIFLYGANPDPLVNYLDLSINGTGIDESIDYHASTGGWYHLERRSLVNDSSPTDFYYTTVTFTSDGPSMEVELYGVSDLSGNPRTVFSPGETVQVVLKARNSGPAVKQVTWGLKIAPGGDHADVRYENVTAVRTMKNDGKWNYLSFLWTPGVSEPQGAYDLLGIIRDGADGTTVLDDTESGSNTISLGSASWLTSVFNVDLQADALAVFDSYSGADANTLTGLDWDGANIWSVTKTTPGGNSTHYRHSMDVSLSVAATYTVPVTSLEDLAWQGGVLWTSDNDTDRILKLDTDLESILSAYAGAVSDGPSGLAWNSDSSSWWSCEGEVIYRHNNDAELTESASFSFPGTQMTGLRWIDGRLWSVDARNYVYLHKNDASLSIDSIFTVPGASALSGITYDGTDLWVSDQGLNKIHRCGYPLRQPPIAEVVDVDLNWSTGGDGVVEWYGQVLVSSDGIDAARSGAIADSQITWVQTEPLTGTGTFSFSWKVSSEERYDFLRFYDNATLVYEISGDEDWHRVSYTVPDDQSPHTLKWAYEKDGSFSRLEDAGWLDEVAWTQCGTSLLAPTLSTPADGAVDVELPPQVAWGDVTDATKYDVQICADSGCLTVLRSALDVADLQWDVSPPLEPGTTYHWRVQARDDGCGASPWSAAHSFSTLSLETLIGRAVDNETLPWSSGGDLPWGSQSAVTRVDDVDAAQTGGILGSQTTWVETEVDSATGGMFSFSWKVSSEAEHDALHFSVDGEVLYTISGDRDWFQQTLSLPAGLHTLRWSYGKDGSNSMLLDAGWLDGVEWTECPATVGIPVLEAPVDGATGVVPAQVLDWADVTNATGYAVQVCGDSLCEALLWEELELTASQWVVVNPSLAFGESYYWRTRAQTECVTGAWSDPWYFSTAGVGGTAVSLGEALDNISLTWTSGGAHPWEGLSDGGRNGDDGALSGDLSDNEVSWVQTTVTGPGTISFYWKVGSEPQWDQLMFTVDGEETIDVPSISGTYDWTPESAQIPDGEHILRWSFEKDRLDDGVFTDRAWLDAVQWSACAGLALPWGLSPLDGVNLAQSTTPRLDWMNTASSYDVQVCGDSSCSAGSIIANKTVAVSEWTVDGGLLLTNERYYWRVRSKSTCGTGEWTDPPNSFPTTCPTPEIPAQPVSPPLEELTFPVPWLIWNASTNTKSYDVKICSENDFNCDSPAAEFRSSTVRSVADVLQWWVNEPLPTGKTYFWWVGATNACGEREWNDPAWIFNVGDKCGQLRPPVIGLPTKIEGVPRLPQLQWYLLDSVVGYDVEICRDPLCEDNPVIMDVNENTAGFQAIANADTVGFWSTLPMPAAEELDWGKQYWWRVRGKTDCGAGPFSQTTDFETLKMPLHEAVDNTELVFNTRSTSAVASWVGQSYHSSDGVDAAGADNVPTSGAAWLETTVTGPGTVTFWWMVKSEEGSDFIRFTDNETVVEKMSGLHPDFQQVSYCVPSGSRSLAWSYEKDGAGSAFEDTGFVDMIVWQPGVGDCDPPPPDPTGSFDPGIIILLLEEEEGL